MKCSGDNVEESVRAGFSFNVNSGAVNNPFFGGINASGQFTFKIHRLSSCDDRFLRDIYLVLDAPTIFNWGSIFTFRRVLSIYPFRRLIGCFKGDLITYVSISNATCVSILFIVCGWMFYLQFGLLRGLPCSRPNVLGTSPNVLEMTIPTMRLGCGGRRGRWYSFREFTVVTWGLVFLSGGTSSAGFFSCLYRYIGLVG